MKVMVDRERCSGHARCAAVLPELFDTDTLGYSVVTASGPVPDELVNKLRLAVMNCPEQAIVIVGDE